MPASDSPNAINNSYCQHKYVTVPVPVWDDQQGSVVRPILSQPPAPEGAGVGGGASLGTVVSISHTGLKPSDIAWEALGVLEALPYYHPLQRYQPVCKDFCEYLDLCEQKGFVAHGYDTRSGKFKDIHLDYENRYSVRRRRELSQKLDLLEYWFEIQKDHPVTMISLTCYHKGETIDGAWIKLNQSRDKLTKLIRKYFEYEVIDGKVVKTGIDYFWVPEPHESGYIHYHMAVFADVSNNHESWTQKYGIDWYLGKVNIEDKFRDLWSRKYKTGSHTYGLDFSHKKDDGKIKSLKGYLTKYLRKGFMLDKWEPNILVFNALLWYTGFRLYGASKRISAIMKCEDDKDSTVVWLETKLNDVKTIEQPDGTTETYNEDRVIWYRQYIPDWLDSPFWIQDRSPNLRLYDPDPLYIYDWGRRYKDEQRGYDPTDGKVNVVSMR